MFLALCREGEHALLPSGRKVVITGTIAGAIKYQDLESGEEGEIMPRHLRHLQGGPEGAPLLAIQPSPEDFVEMSERVDELKGAKERADDV